MDDVSVFTAGAFFGVIASAILILIIALKDTHDTEEEDEEN